MIAAARWLPGCFSALLAIAALAAQDPAWATPPLSDQVAVRDGRTGERIAFAEMLKRLAQVDAVFVGETHLDETTHRVELAIYQGLLQLRENQVVLSLEMFERDAQKTLNSYLAGQIDETTMLVRSRAWGNYRTAYRRLIECAKTNGVPVVAANFPRPLRSGISSGGDGDDPFAKLPTAMRPLAPKQLFANSPAYWRRVDNAVRGHLGMMGGPHAADDPRLTDMQSLWDNSMGEACANALDQYPGSAVVHVCGGFHTAYWDGTARQFAQRKPEAKVLTVDIVPVDNPAAGKPSGLARADFVIYAEARANDVNEGTYSVVTSRELRYVLHIPHAASIAQPVPLLIWLSDDGLTAQDGIDLWRSRIGNEVAIAVLEAPYRERGPDLGESGRWFWPDTFQKDIAVMVQAVERTWGYLLRNQPIDPNRVALIGEGSGATTAAAVTMLSSRLSSASVALDPHQYAKIKDFPLPLPELRGDDAKPASRLVVLGSDSDQKWWASELQEYTAIGLDNEFRVRSDDAWARGEETERAVRTALGLPNLEPATGKRRHVIASAKTPRARHWARLLALQVQAAGERIAVLDAGNQPSDSELVDTAVHAKDFQKSGPRQLPLCPDSFGGTTVVALGADTPDDELQAWLELEQNDPLTARSRFHRVRIATASGERALDQVLAQLRASNRNNVLILPAVFCADSATMRALQELAGDADAMTLHWLPGLGAGN